MAFSKISYLTVSETSTTLFSQQDSKYYVFCKWETACWKCKVRRFVYLIRNDKDLDFQFLPCCSTLYSKHRVQVQLQVFLPFCKSAVAQPFRGCGCNASFSCFHAGQQSPCLPTLALHWVSQYTHTFSFGPVLQIGSGNQLMIKNNPSWPQSTVWDWRLCQVCRKQWTALSQSPMENLAN